MADAKVTALSAISAVALADLVYVVDDVAGTPTSTKATVLQLMAATGLLHTAGTDADTTMAVGAMYVVDMSAWATADRTYTLPGTAAVGDRIGIMVTAGDATHELIITAGTGDTLNGISGGTEWSRLFMSYEVVIMRCVAANATWIVEHDGRKFESCRIDTDGTVESPSPTRNTAYKITDPLTTETSDNGDLWDNTNKRFIPRRKGRYLIHGHLQMANMTSGNTCVALLYKNGASIGNGGSSPAVTASALYPEADVLMTYDVTTVGDYFELYVYYSDSSANKTTNNGNVYFEATRIGDAL